MRNFSSSTATHLQVTEVQDPPSPSQSNGALPAGAEIEKARKEGDLHKLSLPIPIHKERVLGAGRSAQVVLREVATDYHVAVKQFGVKDGLASLANQVLLGVPNLYSWNIHALATAHFRRAVLKSLLGLWFDGKVTVSDSLGYYRDRESGRYVLDTVFIKGRNAALMHPYNDKQQGELATLTKDVMKPLQAHLHEAGFVGSCWQAGLGNPVALNNFLLSDQGQWVCIDFESGVPALAAVNPFSLSRLYIPEFYRRGRPLFDDVNCDTLRRYVGTNQERLSGRLGATGFEKLLCEINALEENQSRWNKLNRVELGILYAETIGRITPHEAAWWRERPWRWACCELFRGIASAGGKIVTEFIPTIFRLAAKLPGKVGTLIKEGFYCAFYDEYRLEKVQAYIEERVVSWQERKHLSLENAEKLRQENSSLRSNPFLKDLGLTTTVVYGAGLLLEGALVVPICVVYGAGFLISTAAVLATGPAVRTLYSLFRIGTSAPRNRPWVALATGMIPKFGVTAYLAQIAWSKTEHKSLAKFMIYDLITRLGTKIPIWGGQDTLTEHLFNRMAARILGTADDRSKERYYKDPASP